jgi:glycogen synthase
MLMRIALVTREFPPETAWGGIGKFYSTFARALSDAGHDVEVFTQALHAGRTEEWEGVLVHRIVPRRWLIGPRTGGDLGGVPSQCIGVFALALAVAMAARVLARHRVKPFDLVEGHEHLGINAIVNLFGRSRFATLTRLHTAYHTLVRRRIVDWPVSRLIRMLERYSLSSAHDRIAPTAFIDLRTREDFPGVPAAGTVIPLLPDELSHEPVIPIAQRERLVVFAGRLMPGHKNPALAARAFSRIAAHFPDWRIEFAGMDIHLESGGTAWDECEAQLKALPGRYHYHGVLDRPGVQALYGRARIALIPSSFESFGLVAMEAMAAGAVPVVADGTALPEVVGESGICFANGSLDHLESVLAGLMEDEELQERLSKSAVDRVRRVYSPSAILARNLEFYRYLAACRKDSNA